MKKISGFILCLIMTCFLFSQNSVNNPTKMYEQGMIYLQQYKNYEAIEQFQQALGINPSYADCWLGLAKATYALEDFELSLKYIQKAKNFLPNNSQVDNLKGYVQLSLGRLEDARVSFLEVLQKYPNDVDARFGLAQLELYDGKISGAENWYLDALQRQNSNRKALLSLSLVSYQLEKYEQSKSYIEKAMELHSGNAEVFYFAAYLDMLDKNYENAEGKCRSAILLNENYSNAYELLAIILFEQGRYAEVVEICDELIQKNRNFQTPWYLKAISLKQLGQVNNTINTFANGLQIASDNEMMRATCEFFIEDNLPVEDPSRKTWAEYHVKKAKEDESRFFTDSALYEYRRALRLDPLNNKVRINYADVLLHMDYEENYLAQMEFVSQTDSSRNVSEIIETYQAYLQDSLSNKWNVDNLLLEKKRLSLGLYPFEKNPQLLHPGSEKILCHLIEDSFTASPYFKVFTNDYCESYTQAFKQARISMEDYFALVSLEESDRDIAIELLLYSGRTGNLCKSFKVYRTGNYRLANAVQKITKDIKNEFAIRGKILKRSGDVLLLDCGKIDGVKVDDLFTVVKKNQLNTMDSEIGLTCHQNDILGYVTVTQVGEEICQGIFKTKGFYDRVNIGDEVFIAEIVEDSSEENKAIAQKQKFSFKKTKEEFKEVSSINEDFDLKPKNPLLIQLLSALEL